NNGRSDVRGSHRNLSPENMMAATPTYGPEKRRNNLEIVEYTEIMKILDPNLQDTIKDMVNGFHLQ
ncbi:10983_t:CDS:1, partial [Funneliformis caledonium]